MTLRYKTCGPILIMIMAIVAISCALSEQPPAYASRQAVRTVARKAQQSFSVSPDECRQALAKVDQLVRGRFYNRSLATTAWADYLKIHKDEILRANNLRELRTAIDDAIKVLHSSHCEFVTTNDEMYYFLNSMFAGFNKNYHSPAMDFTGAITGGVKCPYNCVRYVLDGSPAEQAGMKIGDELSTVEGKPYQGQSSFWGTAGRQVKVSIKRQGRNIDLNLRPQLRNDYQEYIAAIGSSARTFKVPGKTLGYVHLWAGGTPAHEAFERVMSNMAMNTDGLILDLRAGYGGNFLNDLDYFYRPPEAYPAFQTTNRAGKKHGEKLYYDKPVVALIDGGVRSGKELLAYSLKKTGRAKLVGERTAGAVVAGSLQPVDSRMALYLAVLDVEMGGTRLEGVGVSPDEEVISGCSQQGWDRQLASGTKALIDELSKQR